MRKRTRALLNNPWADVSSWARDGELQADAGRKLRGHLLGKFTCGELTAQDLCLISFWHTRSGGCGLEDLGLEPSNIKNASRHVGQILRKDFDMPECYYVEVPTYDKFACRRVKQQVPVKLASETLRCEEAPTAELATDRAEWHDAYERHPVVARARAAGWPEPRIRPVALYWDGVQYTRRDTFMGFYFEDMRSGTRYLSSLLRACPNLPHTRIEHSVNMCGQHSS